MEVKTRQATTERKARMRHQAAKDPYAQTPLILDKISYDYGRRQKQGARVLDEISLEDRKSVV